MKKILLFFAIAFMITLGVNAQVLVEYNTDSSTSNATLPATNLDTNVSSTSLSAGDGINANAGGTWNWKGFNNSADDTWMFTITPNNEVSVKLSEIKFRVDRSGTGPQNLDLSIMANGNTYNVLTGANVSASGSNFTVNLSSIPTIGANNPIEFIFKPTNASAGGGTFDLEKFSGESFGIQVSASSILPVEFTSIKAKKNDGYVDVAWQTASELNNEMFVVERSKDGINFTSIGEVEGQGTSTRIQNYVLTDDAPLSGVSYYRVKQVDFDGAYDYSEMVSVTMDVKSIRVTPTATYDITTIYAEESTEIVVYDMTGATVTNMLPQNGQYDIDLSNAAKGIYMAVISYGTHTETVKLIRL